MSVVELEASLVSVAPTAHEFHGVTVGVTSGSLAPAVAFALSLLRDAQGQRTGRLTRTPCFS
jgi:hypothetical protein